MKIFGIPIWFGKYATAYELQIGRVWMGWNHWSFWGYSKYRAEEVKRGNPRCTRAWFYAWPFFIRWVPWDMRL